MPDMSTCSSWDHGYCPECVSYKKDCTGYPVKPEDMGPALFKTLGLEKMKPGHDATSDAELPKVTLRLVDVEHNTSRPCDITEAKTWDWQNSQVMRIIGDWQIASYEMLLFKLREKEESGITEVDLFEAPRFMMLAGG